MRRQAGLTMVELVVTITVGGIVIAAAVPNIRSYQESQRVNRASEAISVACREARAKARAQNHSVIVEYRVDEGQVVVIEDVDNDGVVDNDEIEVVRELGVGASLASTTFASNRLVFDSRGNAVNGGSVFVQGREGTMPKRVRILAGTGHVSIQTVESAQQGDGGTD